jgi:hypothetical protein
MPKMTEPAESRTPTMAEIGRALGLSRQAVHTLNRRGMPVHSVEAAHAWRLAHLDPARRKAGDFDRELSIRQRLAQAQALMSAAADALAGGNEPAFAALVPALREAMREIPEPARDRLLLDVAVMDRLVAPEREMIEACEAEDRVAAEVAGAPAPTVPGSEDLAAMGAFWYSLAAGEGFTAAFRHLEDAAEGVAA